MGGSKIDLIDKSIEGDPVDPVLMYTRFITPITFTMKRRSRMRLLSKSTLLGPCFVACIINLSLSTPAFAEDITQHKCSDSSCTQNCQTAVVQATQCFKTGTSSSESLQCTETGGVINATIYQSSNSCTGFSYNDQLPAGSCMSAKGGGYVMFSCGTNDLGEPE